MPGPLKPTGRAVLAALLVIVVVFAALMAMMGRERLLELALGPVDIMAVDFATLKKTPKPNQYLVCPPDLCAGTPDRRSPEYDFPAEQLAAHWQAMTVRQPRTRRTARDEAAMQDDYVQRSWAFRFPDTITVKFIPLGGNRSTLAIYSRSHYGRSDLGVNKKRIEAWLADLAGTP